jgi:hypothetical protein
MIHSIKDIVGMLVNPSVKITLDDMVDAINSETIHSYDFLSTLTVTDMDRVLDDHMFEAATPARMFLINRDLNHFLARIRYPYYGRSLVTKLYAKFLDNLGLAIFVELSDQSIHQIEAYNVIEVPHGNN